jgi:predicted nucleotidyltransferase
MIDLRDSDRSLISKLAKEHLIKGTELWAYGSRVKGTALDTSDLDLVICTPDDAINDLFEFIEALQHSNLPIFVQVFDDEHFPDNFRKNFEEQKELLLTVDG